MNKKEILEFVKEHEQDETCFIIEVNVLNDDIVIFANNEIGEEDCDNGWLTVFENTESSEHIGQLVIYLNGIKKENTGLYIEYGCE